MSNRTRIAFPFNYDVWPVVASWASANGYWARGSTGPERLYQKGTGFWVAPMMLSIRQENGQVVMEGWVRCNFFVRLSSFFILPAEIQIQSGGFKAILPRKIARDAVNILLQQLGQPLIP